MVDSCTCTVWPVIYTAVKLIMAMPPMAVWLVVQLLPLLQRQQPDQELFRAMKAALSSPLSD